MEQHLSPLGSTKWFNFSPLFATPSRFRPHTWAAGEATAALNSGSSATPPQRPLFSGVLGIRTILCPQRSFLHPYIFVRENLILYSAGSPRPPHLCRPWRFSICKLQTTRLWSVDSSEPPLTRTSNTERNKSAETMQKSMSDRWTKEFRHQVYLCTSLWRKKVFMMHSALLQHSCSKSLPLSFQLRLFMGDLNTQRKERQLRQTSASPCRPIGIRTIATWTNTTWITAT